MAITAITMELVAIIIPLIKNQRVAFKTLKNTLETLIFRDSKSQSSQVIYKRIQLIMKTLCQNIILKQQVSNQLRFLQLLIIFQFFGQNKLFYSSESSSVLQTKQLKTPLCLNSASLKQYFQGYYRFFFFLKSTSQFPKGISLY